MDPNSTEAELESFRQKWREEVSARSKGKQPATQTPATTKAGQAAASSSKHHKSHAPEPSSHGHARRNSEDADESQPRVYHDIDEKEHGRRLDSEAAPSAGEDPQSVLENHEKSALEHYERAVEREKQGSLGDSLNLYRKAFKLDDKVHETYKAKHYPPSYFKRHPPTPSTSKFHPPSASTSHQTPTLQPSTTEPNPTSSNRRPSVSTSTLTSLPPTLASLLSSFANLSIPGAEPPTEFSPPPPCPISTLPEEILVEILQHLAVSDVASFARLSQVCKRLAYLTNTEDRIWKRVAQGHEYGFAAMHYDFACEIDGSPLPQDFTLGLDDLSLDDTPSDSGTATPARNAPSIPHPLNLVPTPIPTYQHLFRHAPRLRFPGLYISTVNYTRPGSASVTQITWNAPIHIVTYYRYLRFLRDGSCISLLTTAEPADVVPFFKPNMVGRPKQSYHAGVPGVAMKDAVLGRWKMCVPSLSSDDRDKDNDNHAAHSTTEDPTTVIVEKAGVTAKYMDKMVLRVGHAGRKNGARNTRLSWEGYWSYNRVSDDWAEFGLRNDRPFYWSRVRSWGDGLDE